MIDLNKLILCMKGRPEFYDESSPHYNNKDFKTQTLIHVCKTIVEGWEKYSQRDQMDIVAIVHDRWDALKCSFKAEFNIRHRMARINFEYYDQLRFLIPHLYAAEHNQAASQAPRAESEVTRAESKAPRAASEAPRAATEAPQASGLQKSTNRVVPLAKTVDPLTAEEEADLLFIRSFWKSFRGMDAYTKKKLQTKILKVVKKIRNVMPSPETGGNGPHEEIRTTLSQETAGLTGRSQERPRTTSLLATPRTTSSQERPNTTGLQKTAQMTGSSQETAEMTASSQETAEMTNEKKPTTPTTTKMTGSSQKRRRTNSSQETAGITVSSQKRPRKTGSQKTVKITDSLQKSLRTTMLANGCRDLRIMCIKLK